MILLLTKSISIDVQKAVSWNSYIVLSKDSLSMIQFWKKNLNSLNEKAFITDFACHTIAYSDASGTGFGGYVVETPINIAHGMWSEDERLLSSTRRELMAVTRVLMSLKGRLANKHVKWFSDNQNVIRIVQRGSMKPALLDIALSIFEFCLMSNIRLDINWIPRAENQQADFLSKIVDFDDWGVSNEIFHYLDSLWGPHEIDFFADNANHKLPVFYSRFWTPDAVGFDAFTVDWHGVNGWIVPPVCLLSKVLRYMRQCNACCTVILPLWKSASYWPLISVAGGGFIPEVVGCVDLPTKKEYYVPGKFASMFGKIDLPFRMLALRFNFEAVFKI